MILCFLKIYTKIHIFKSCPFNMRFFQLLLPQRETSSKHVSYIAIEGVCACANGRQHNPWLRRLFIILNMLTQKPCLLHPPFAWLFKTDMPYCTLSIVTSASSFLQQSIRPQQIFKPCLTQTP